MSRCGFATLVAVAVLTATATGGGAHPPPPPVPLDTAWAAGDCARCHEVPGQEPLPRVENCTVCHEWIRTVSANPRARAKAIELFPKWERYERNTTF